LVITAEFGLSNLSIPKKLLKEKKGQNKPTMLVFFLFLISHDIYVITAFYSAEPSEPPLPYPLPAPFVPLRASNIDNQIELLRPYYHNWIALLVASSAPPIAVAPAPLPGPALGPSLTSLNSSVPPPLPSHTIPPGTHSNMSNPLANPPALATPLPDLIFPDEIVEQVEAQRRKGKWLRIEVQVVMWLQALQLLLDLLCSLWQLVCLVHVWLILEHRRRVLWVLGLGMCGRRMLLCFFYHQCLWPSDG
jgi:hypothetical protein